MPSKQAMALFMRVCRGASGVETSEGTIRLWRALEGAGYVARMKYGGLLGHPFSYDVTEAGKAALRAAEPTTAAPAPASPLPWTTACHQGPRSHPPCIEIRRAYDADGEADMEAPIIARVPWSPRCEDDAEALVHACNAYPALLAERDALRAALRGLVDRWAGLPSSDPAVLAARAALAAGGTWA